jgi:CBS domain-containing protein/predicted CoA-binding protein
MKDYSPRKQRKMFLESCRRIAVVGIDTDPDSASFVATEKLLGLGMEILPVISGRRELLGMPCYARFCDIAGEIDLVQVYPGKRIHLPELAREAAEKRVKAFWVEEGSADPAVTELLTRQGVQVVEHESLVREYIKHVPSPAPPRSASKAATRAMTVGERMTRNPVTVKAGDALKDALDKMKQGRFRHLPVIDDAGKLIGMISDRDIRLIRPSAAFVSPEDAAAQLWSVAVRQAAVFNPVTIQPDAPLEKAAELMLRWDVGGLPVANDGEKLVGIITYSDLLREFVARAQ